MLKKIILMSLLAATAQEPSAQEASSKIQAQATSAVPEATSSESSTQAEPIHTPAPVAPSEGPIDLSLSDRYRFYSQPHVMQVTVKTSAGAVEKAVYKVYSQDQDSLAVQTFPERSADRKLLMKDEDLWLYTPGIKKPIRIGLDQRLVGDVSNGDILRTRFKEDYKAEPLESKDKEVTYRLLKNSRSATYAEIRYTLDRRTHRPLRAEFYAASGLLLKSAAYRKFRKIGGETLCVEIQIVDAQTQRISTITYEGHRKYEFSDDFFNKDRVVNFSWR